MVGLKDRLLFLGITCLPAHIYSPQTALVIHRGPEFRLSCMTHGQHWQQRREPLEALPFLALTSTLMIICERFFVEISDMT